MKILILNGPPNVGKDTLADNLVKTAKGIWHKCSFKEKLYYDVANYYSVDVGWFKTIATNRVTKEIKFTELGYISPREAMIYVSEEIIKPTYGKDHYGKKLLERVKFIEENNGDMNFVIPDGGFEEEVQVLMDAYPENVWIVHMKSKDCSFKNDSRDYIKGWPDNTFELEINRGYPLMDYEELVNIIDEIEDISVARSRLNDEPDDTPYMTEDFEGDRHYIGEENE